MTDVMLGDGISEVIATTHGERINAAPMGVVNRNFLYIRMYKSSHTFLNVKQNGQLVANLVLDPRLYVKAAFDDLESSCFYDDDGSPVLKAAYAWVEFACSVRDGSAQRNTIVRLRPVRSKILDRPIVPVNRGFNAVIEATVHATRYHALQDPKYLELIDYYGSIVTRCGGQQELQAFKLLKTYVAKAVDEATG
ncbi:MAG: DUF447 domain-containing protein [Halobacteriota archaeon]